VSFRRVAIIGLGLMGGSLALALRRASLAAQIVGCGRRVRLDQALALGAIDGGDESAAEAVRDCDLIVLCTPVETSIRLMGEIASSVAPEALITDVGSTKLAFAEAARQLFGAAAAERVLPAHPLAGSERSGLENASAELYRGCIWALTPLAAELTGAQRKLQAMIEALGARTLAISPQEHDRVLALTSHLPQMLSTALALVLERALGEGNPALQLHGSGLNSMLRLATSDPVMWEQIATSNREQIAAALEAMEVELRQLRHKLGKAEFRAEFEAARRLARSLRD
jgi:prephenate dehydrogenase